MASRPGGAGVQGDTSERALLRAIRARTGGRNKAVRVGIGDDCAVLATRPEEEVVVTTDFSIEGRHFRFDTHAPEAIGHKCLARGLSDVAAMGARPSAAFLSLALPKALTRARGRAKSWIARFYDGLLALAEQEGVMLAGGDLSEAPLTVADITVVGRVARGRALLRSTAQAGDVLYVTGSLGGAAVEHAGVEARRRAGAARTSNRYPGPMMHQEQHPHFYPLPRLAVGQVLGRRGLATACIDISDGLSVDLLHLCEESGLSAEVDAAAIPLAEWNGTRATLAQALHGGDDYELLFTAAMGTQIPGRLKGITVRAIGRMVKKKGLPAPMMVTLDGNELKRMPLRPQGWEHF